MSTLRSTGTKIVCDNLKYVFVHGAYNLGPITEWREVETAGFHPGEGIEHDKGAGGEDSYTEHSIRSATAYGVAEIDFDQISSCVTDYAVGDDIPGIPYHLNPGAYLRNIQCVDPTADIEPDQVLIISPATTGSFIQLIEVPLKDSVTGSPEAFDDAVVIGDSGAIFAGRSPMRNAYFIADTGAAHTVVAYIIGG